MKKLLFLVVLLLAFTAQSQVVISEVYGGGGNAGSTFTNDFVELYNPTSCPVSLAGWSVQYASATGSSWQVTPLTGTIGAKCFYLIGEAQGTGGTISLPAPNDTGTIAMAAGAGKVALVNTTTALTGTCPTGGQIIDFAGYGTTANCFLGTGAAPPPSASSSIERKASATSTATTLAAGGTEELSGNGYTSGNNNTDFITQSGENPQNTASGTEGTVSNTATVAAGTMPAEPSTNGTFTVTLSTAAPAGGTTFTYTLSGTATAGVDYTDVQGGALTIPAGSTTGTINIAVIDDLLTEGTETLILTPATVSGSSVFCAGNTATLNLTDDDIATAFIHTIQGSGMAATAGAFTVSAVVTAVYPDLSPAGFYIQEEDSDADTDTATSEGIYVVSNAAVAVGHKVQVTGTVQENAASPSFGQAVFTNATIAVLSSNNALPTAANVYLPLIAVTDLEKYEGMMVKFPATLTVTNNFTLGRYGEVGLSAGGLVYQPSQVVDPNDNPNSGTSSAGSSNASAISALIAANNLRTVLLDDGTNSTTTLPYVDAIDSTLRIGSTITDLRGIMTYSFGVYRIQPVPYNAPVFAYAARPAVPAVGAANVKLASFNVLNYFNGDGAGGGFPTARGAHSLAEFGRQRAKIITAISLLNADVVGLTEIENDGTGSTSAIQDLVNGLNAAMGAGTYAFINDGATVQPANTDAIRCGILYKPTVVTPSGTVIISVDSAFNRPPVAQAFTSLSNGQKFNFIINHFKSKGCTSSTGADGDQSDGQGCYNERRKAQATALLAFISTTVIPTSGSNRVVSVGDYNAYEEEDPLDIFRAGGYTVLGDSSLYSYQFNGQVGALDHAVISANLVTSITGFAKWNINAAEPVYLDYSDGINDGGGDIVNPFASTYTPSAYRSSDHDPVLIGLSFPLALPAALPFSDAGLKAYPNPAMEVLHLVLSQSSYVTPLAGGNSSANAMRLYPNPNTATATIELAQEATVNMLVMNLSGQLVANLGTAKKTAVTHSWEWNTANIPAGTYFVTALVNGIATTQKIVVAH